MFWLQNRWGNVPLDDHLRRLVQESKVTPFRQLFEYNEFVRVDAEWSMATATAFVKFVVERWGTEGLLNLYASINGMNAYLPIASAFETSFGVPLDQAEGEFHSWLVANYGQ